MKNQLLKLPGSFLVIIALVALPVVLSACSPKSTSTSTPTSTSTSLSTFTGTLSTAGPTISYIIVPMSLGSSLIVGDTKQLSASAAWSDGRTEDVTAKGTWISSDENVISVSPTGLATAIGPGKATVNMSLDGVSSGSVSIIVKIPGYDLTSIAVSRGTISNLAVGATLQLKATGTTRDGIAKDITSMAAWTSSDTKIATVSSSGLITAISPGKTTIYAELSEISSVGIVITVESP